MNSTEITIEKKNYVPQIEKVSIQLPTEVVCYFITGIRKSYYLKPNFPEWNKHNLYSYSVIEVGLSFEYTMKTFEFSVKSIPDILNDTRHKAFNIVEHLVNYPTDGIRSVEQFTNDYNNVVSQTNDVLNA